MAWWNRSSKPKHKPDNRFDDEAQYLVGKFSDAKVYVGDDNDQTIVHPSVFDQSQHAIRCGDQTYKFINPDEISASSISALREEYGATVFDNTQGMRVHLTTAGYSIDME